MDRRFSPLRCVQARKPQAALVVGDILLGCVVIPTSAIAQQVYKWTDSNGQTHYSDHAPTDQAATTVNVPKTPPPKPAVTPEPLTALPYPTGDNGRSTPADPAVLARQREQSRAEAVARNKQADQELVDKCKAQRDTDCNQISEIKKREAIQNEPPPPKWRCVGIVPTCGFVDQTPPHTNSANTPPAANKKKSTSKYTIQDN